MTELRHLTIIELVHLWNTSNQSARYRDEIRTRAAEEFGYDPLSPQFVAYIWGEYTRLVEERAPRTRSTSAPAPAPANGVQDVRRQLEEIRHATNIRAAFEALKQSGCTLNDPRGLVTMPAAEMWDFVDEVIGGIARPFSEYTERQRNLINMIIDVYGREFMASRQ